jgi:hypothetical protein
VNDLIETACHNACQAMHRESTRAIRAQESPQTCLILAAALDALLVEGVSGNDLVHCADRLRRSAAPRRVG